MTSHPIRFGVPGRQLFGMHHVPVPADDLAHGVLICNSFGQEAIRCHRLLKVLADRLARAGLHVLRFDYCCTGDSDGDDADATFEAWIDDVQAAREALERASGARGTSWFGLRLGASIAMLASARGRAPERLVLWDPIVDGAAYLGELARAHTAALEAQLERAVPVPPLPLQEVLGFPLGGAVHAPMQALRASSYAATRAARIRLLHSPGAAGIDELEGVLRAGPARVDRAALASRIVWASDEAMNSAIVPADAVQAVMEAFMETA